MDSSLPFRSAAVAYLITFRTYGSWIPGDERGSVHRYQNLYDTELVGASVPLARRSQANMTGQAVTLDDRQRHCIERTIQSVAEYRSWTITAIAVRTNHVHVVVEADATAERVMNDFKSWCTRRLRERNLVARDRRVWSRHGSTRYLWDDDAVKSAIDYVVEGQGDWVT